MEKATSQNLSRENHYGISVCGVDEIKTTKLNPSEARGIDTNTTNFLSILIYLLFNSALKLWAEYIAYTLLHHLPKTSLQPQLKIQITEIHTRKNINFKFRDWTQNHNTNQGQKIKQQQQQQKKNNNKNKKQTNKTNKLIIINFHQNKKTKRGKDATLFLF